MNTAIFVAFALLALFFGAMIFDAIKAARKEGGEAGKAFCSKFCCGC